ncbi:MAG: hypothetical protein WD208_00880 [Dehalococcoidia bacterium]
MELRKALDWRLITVGIAMLLAVLFVMNLLNSTINFRAFSGGELVTLLVIYGFWGAVIGVGLLVATRVIRLLNKLSDGAPSTDDSLTVVNRRYAAGEISRDEYLVIRRDISG